MTEPEADRGGGFSCFTVGIALAVVLVVAAIAIPNLIEARKHGGEASQIGALKTITTSQTLFREGDKENDGNLDYGMLAELGAVRLIDDVLASGTKQGYVFEACYSPTTSEFLWWATALPLAPDATREFFVNQAGTIFYTTKRGSLVLNREVCEIDSSRCSVTPIGR